jgi:hypothetical protein
MFNYSYHLTPTKKPGVVRLRPTKETWVKAFAPSLVIFGGFWVVGTYLQYKEKKELEETLASDKK